MTGIARLWDQHFNWLATHRCTEPHIDGTEFSIEVKGNHAFADAVRQQMREEPNLHLTYDPDPDNLDDYRNRIVGVVTKLEVAERDCDCGNRITTTTISAARPLMTNDQHALTSAEVQRAIDQLVVRGIALDRLQVVMIGPDVVEVKVRRATDRQWLQGIFQVADLRKREGVEQ